ncbi:MAG: PKD domain-containing protein [Candidatus Thermoplasmatota archaeon]|nr:PKD domain-containing protein [Candidatus Thermoplasmatota archaeon]MBS3789983.1 PKD domain-containing protein [Candidatus Thermoplasmatota archaeon]
MKSGKIGKMATALTILLLVASGLMVVQWNAQPVEASEHENEAKYKINGLLDLETGEENTELDILLRDLSTGEIVEEETTGDYYSFTGLTPGYYEVILPSQHVDGYSYWRAVSDNVTVEHGDKDTYREDIDTITYFDVHKTLEVNVTADEDYPVEATVTIEKREDNRKVFSHSVDTQKEGEDYENVSHYAIKVYDGFDGILKVEKDGYAPYVNTSFNATDYNFGEVYEVNLEDDQKIKGVLSDSDEVLISEDIGMQVILYNKSVGMFTHTTNGPGFTIRGPSGDEEFGDFILIVNAEGYKPFVTEVDGSGEKLDEESVEEEGPETIDIDLDFRCDEGSLNVTTIRSLRASTRIENLDYSHLGHLGLQLDMTLGDKHNYNLTEGDLDKFEERLSYTQKSPTTQEFVEVDDTVYKLKDTTFSGFIDKNEVVETLTGDIANETEKLFEGDIEFETSAIYEPVDGGIEDEAHNLDLWVTNNHTFGNERKFNYDLYLPSGYERYEGDDTAEDWNEDEVKVFGYTDLKIYPQYLDDGGPSRLTFDLRESKEGDVEILVDPENEVRPNIFEKEEEGDWVIRKGTNLTFRAEYMANTSQAINYHWTWGDISREGEDFTYTFNETMDKDEVKELKVKIEESSGNEIGDSINITVDGEGPTGEHIVVNDENVTVDGSIDVNETLADEEGEGVEFSAVNFNDTHTGIVNRYQWNFSDGSEIQEGMNVTHPFEVPGYYNLTLNVTDIVGNWNEEKITINVTDITEPIGDFTFEWNNESDDSDRVNIEIGTKVTFNATDFQPHPDYDDTKYKEKYDSNLTFDWEIKEMNETSEEQKWSFNFTHEENVDIGEYTVHLNVTDEEGNVRTIEKTINIVRGPTPDLYVSELRVSKEDIRAGDTVTLTVNVTNIGGANTTAINPVLKIDEVETGDYSITYIYNETDYNNLEDFKLGPGEDMQVEIEWSPENDGEQTINVNVTDAEESNYPTLVWDNDVETTLSVDPPAWREYIVYALIPIIIIGVTVGLYFYKDKISELLK